MGLKLTGRLVALMATGAIVLTACGTGAATPAASTTASVAPSAGGGTGDLTIGVTFPILDQFLQTVADGMQAKADEIGGVTLNIVSAEEKTDAQLGQVENFISQGVDAIVVIPVDTDAAGPMTDCRHGRGHPARVRQPPPVRPATDGRSRTSAPTRSTRARSRWRSWPSWPAARATSSS